MTPVHASHFFDHAFVGGELRYGVRLEIDRHGAIESVQCDTAARPDDRHHALGLPGMPNVHSHAHQYALAGRTERSSENEDNFWTWRQAMYRLAGHMTPEQFHAIASQLYLELLKGGYTCVGEFQYVHHGVDGSPFAEPALMSQQALRAADDVGIGITILPVLYRFSDFGGAGSGRDQRRFVNTADSYLRIVEALAKETREHPLRRTGLAPHSLRAVSSKLLSEVLAASPLPDTAPIHIHVAEQTREVDDAKRMLHRRPVEYLLEHFDINSRWCLVHATHMKEDETDRLAATGATAGLCPTTEANLGDGIFPAVRYLHCGGQIAVGSDSNVTTDAASELRLLEYTQRLHHRSRNRLSGAAGSSTGQNLLHRAQLGGARALGQPVGTLAPGSRADFITLNVRHPQLVGRGDDMLDSYVFSAGSDAVRDVYVAGCQVIDSGRHEREDEIHAAFCSALEELA